MLKLLHQHSRVALKKWRFGPTKLDANESYVRRKVQGGAERMAIPAYLRRPHRHISAGDESHHLRSVCAWILCFLPGFRDVSSVDKSRKSLQCVARRAYAATHRHSFTRARCADLRH